MLEKGGALRRGSFGDAAVMICGTVETTEILSRMLAENPDLFSDNEPLNGEAVPEPLPKTKRGNVE
ncbi:hypothetical protein D3C71_2077890 [compost metagenome]